MPHWSPDSSRVLYESLAPSKSSKGDVSISDGTGTSMTALAIQPRGTRWGPRGTRWAPDGMSILSGGWNGSVVTAMVIVDPTGVRQQSSVDVSDLHAGQLSMSWQRVAP